MLAQAIVPPDGVLLKIPVPYGVQRGSGDQPQAFLALGEPELQLFALGGHAKIDGQPVGGRMRADLQPLPHPLGEELESTRDSVGYRRMVFAFERGACRVRECVCANAVQKVRPIRSARCTPRALSASEFMKAMFQSRSSR